MVARVKLLSSVCCRASSATASAILPLTVETVSEAKHSSNFARIGLSRHAHREKVDLFVHHPDQAPLPATTEPQPGLAKPQTPPESVLHNRRQFFDDEEDDAPRARSRGQPSGAAKQEEIIAGIPNDLLLPGAIVALAVVIVGVFAIGRASSR